MYTTHIHTKHPHILTIKDTLPALCSVCAVFHNGIVITSEFNLKWTKSTQ